MWIGGTLMLGQPARRVGLAIRCAGNFTTFRAPDAPAGTKGTMSMLSANPRGAQFILHSAGFLDGLPSMSCKKFMLDSDLCGSLHSCPDGLMIDVNSLTVDTFAGVGPGTDRVLQTFITRRKAELADARY